jgi:integrase
VDQLRKRLLEDHVGLPGRGRVVSAGGAFPPFVLLDGEDLEVDPVTQYLRDLSLSDVSALTCRSYGFDLLRWFRLLWLLEVAWDAATPAEVDLLVGWMRSAGNVQRVRRRPGAPEPGSLNARTGKRRLESGYAPRSINHALSVVSGFYDFHAHQGRGPVRNPVPAATQHQAVLRHRSPLEPVPPVRRARMRQRVPQQLPRAIPDALWSELFAAMGCTRDRALLAIYVSSGVRASELLGLAIEDVDWERQLITVTSKGSRLRQSVPVSPEAMRLLAAYLAEAGRPATGEPVWRTRRGPARPMTYWALRRVLQRANDGLDTDWTLHDLRHTAATRMAHDAGLTLSEVQAVLRHADIATTGIYTAVRVEDLFDKLQEHYRRPTPPPRLPACYDPDDMRAVFGG